LCRKKSNFLVAEVHFLQEEVQVQKAEIFLAFWCAQKRGLPRANFPIGEVILPLAKRNFKLKNLKFSFA
jgi:hypothetical protein